MSMVSEFFCDQGMFLVKYGIIGADATRNWYDEIKKYNFNRPGFTSATGHFTQLVWKGSNRIGVGFALTSDQRTIYVVAQYAPPGNSGSSNEYRKNVSPANC